MLFLLEIVGHLVLLPLSNRPRMWPVVLLLVRPQQSLYECGLVRSGGFALFGVAIDVVDLVATE